MLPRKAQYPIMSFWKNNDKYWSKPKPGWRAFERGTQTADTAETYPLADVNRVAHRQIWSLISA